MMPRIPLTVAVAFAAAVVSSLPDSTVATDFASTAASAASVTATVKSGRQFGFGGTGNDWVDRCGVLAPYCGVLCSLAPLPTIRQVSREKSTGKLPLLPYSSMVANGVVWVIYGVLRDIPSITVANSIGVALGLYYCYEFRRHVDPAARDLPGTVSQHKLVVTWFVLLNLFLVVNLPRRVAAELVGKEGVLVFAILFASPLVALRDVVRSKSAASIPLPFTIACLLNCSLWSVVGLLKMRDFNIYFPSMLGLLCALVQMFLKGIYGNGVVDDTAEMELGKDSVRLVSK